MAAERQVLAGKAAETKNEPLQAPVAYARFLKLAPEHPVALSSAAFLGFEFTTGRVMEMTQESQAQRLYRQAYPGEATLSDLSNWESLEAERPRLFNNYLFWCQKPPVRPNAGSMGDQRDR